MTDRFGPPPAGGWTQIQLEQLKVAVAHRLGPYAAQRLRYEVRDQVADPEDLVQELSTYVLGKSTGARTYEQSRTATASVVRFGSWWDHFKAAHRRRWWMRWRHWRVHYYWREETVVATVKVDADVAVVFPHAQDLPESLGAGYPLILWAQPRR